MKIVFSIFLCFIILTCERNDDKLLYAEAYIVGFDPCTIRNHYDVGYVLFTTDSKDTLVTYNFPNNIYSIPSEYFANYMSSAYFPQQARYEFKIKISYTKAMDNERVIHDCTTDFFFGDFSKQILHNQIIIKSATKY